MVIGTDNNGILEQILMGCFPLLDLNNLYSTQLKSRQKVANIASRKSQKKAAEPFKK